jgi:hypothetical protein
MRRVATLALIGTLAVAGSVDDAAAHQHRLSVARAKRITRGIGLRTMDGYGGSDYRDEGCERLAVRRVRCGYRFTTYDPYVPADENPYSDCDGFVTVTLSKKSSHYRTRRYRPVCIQRS